MREDDSRALFTHGCSIVETCGHEPINPWSIEHMNGTYEDIMQEDLRVIRENADALFVLANYHTSAGSHREIAEAKSKGIPVYYESDVSEFWHCCFSKQRPVTEKKYDKVETE